MRAALSTAPGRGTVVTGEGAKDDALMLADGERLGAGAGPEFDIAVDPLECTTLCAHGLAGSLSAIAVAPRGSMWSPGPSFYMDKLVLPPAARDAADPEHLDAKVDMRPGLVHPDLSPVVDSAATSDASTPVA